MGLVEFHVEDITVETVPKLVLFDRSDRDEPGAVESKSLNQRAGVALVVAIAVGLLLAVKRLQGMELSC